jgi:hypothetical protein
MSGMFQRIARRQADHSDEAVSSESAGDPIEAAPPAADAEQPAADAEQPAADAEQPAADAEQPAAEAQEPAAEAAPPPSDDAPTERIEAVSPASIPPPMVDLRSRIPGPQAPGPAPPAPETSPTTAISSAPVATPASEPVSDDVAATDAAPRRPGFRARGRMRRRLRYLRKLRELQVRDLGGLVFDLRRFERRRDDLVLTKIDQIRACDDELRALERALDERRDLRDVREPGIGGTCPRCFAIFGSADRFCASCGAALGGAVQGPAAVPPAPAPTSDGNAPQ